jgi:hypothetical protein
MDTAIAESNDHDRFHDLVSWSFHALQGQAIFAWVAPAFVWTVWTLILVGSLAFVGVNSSRIPLFDDWVFVPYLAGEAPIGVNWLWSQQNEHRVVLFRLVTITLLKLTDGDFRAPMLFGVAALGGVSFAMIGAAKTLRGRMSITDAFFPLVLFLGTARQFYWATGLFYCLPVALTCGLLLIMVKRGVWITQGSGILAGICLILLTLCGGPGLLLIPAIMIWLAFSWILLWRNNCPPRVSSTFRSLLELESSKQAYQKALAMSRVRRNSCLILAPALIALLITCLYFVGYRGIPAHLASPGLSAALQTSLECFTGSLGSGAERCWPFSGLAMVVLLALSAGVLVHIWRTQTAERSRAAGLVFFAAAMASLVFALGWARSHSGAGVGWQYGILAAPALCCIYFVWGIPRVGMVSDFGQLVLFALVTSMAWPAIQDARVHGTDSRMTMEAFEQDLRNSVPTYALIARHQENVCSEGDEADLSDLMTMLHRAQIGAFRHLQKDPPFRQSTIPVKPDLANEMAWQKGIGYCLTIVLPAPEFVAGIRLQFSHPNYNSAHIRVWWKKDNRAAFPQKAQYDRPRCSLNLEPENNTLTIYIADTIDQIRIHPGDKPFGFHISEMVVLVPAIND